MPLPEIAAAPAADDPVIPGRAEPAPSLVRHGLIPASVVVCFALVYWIRAEPAWLAVVGLPVMLLYLAAPAIGRSSLARFDRDAIRLLSGGRAAALTRRFRHAVGMRLFAPPALVAQRRGMVAAETGDAQEAHRAFRAALDGYPDEGAPLAVRLGLAHAAYAIGDDLAAIAHFRAVLRDGGRVPGVPLRLAHALARSGDDLAEAGELLDRADAELPDGPPPRHLLVRALIHARAGRGKKARALLKRARRASEELEALEDEVTAALGAGSPGSRGSRLSRRSA